MCVCACVRACMFVCVRGPNGDVRLHSGRSGSVEVEIYRGSGFQRSWLTTERNQHCTSRNDHWILGVHDKYRSDNYWPDIRKL